MEGSTKIPMIHQCLLHKILVDYDNDNTDFVDLFKAALEQQRIDTYAITDPTLALQKIKANPNQFHLIIMQVR
jgi:hypothetical protein